MNKVSDIPPEVDIYGVLRSTKWSDWLGGLLLFAILGIASCEPEIIPATQIHQTGDAR